jgi:hypothetical protein
LTHTKDEALRLALEAHKKNERHNTVAETRYWCDQYKLLAEQALAQPEQESVAMADYMNLMEKYVALKAAQPEQEPVFTYEQVKAHIQVAMMSNISQQRTWVGLTSEDYNEIFEKARTGEHAVQLAEAKLKEKNT